MGGYRTKVTAATPQLLPTGQIGAFVAAALERGDSVQYVPAQIVLPFTDIVTVTTLALPVGLEGFAYTAALAALGGTLPYTWGATGLPSWATLSGNTISGTPNSTAPSTLTVTATDADGRVSLPVVLSLQVSGVGLGVFAYAGGSEQRAYVVPGPRIVAAVPTPPTNPGPQAMWPGYQDTVSVTFMWWPPSTQTAWYGANFTGSISGTLLTVNASPAPIGALAAGQLLSNVAPSALLPANVHILSQASGTAGGVGTYNLDTNCGTVAQQSMYTNGAGTPDYYKVYINGVLWGGATLPSGLLYPGVTANPCVGNAQYSAGLNHPVAWYTYRTTASATPSPVTFTVTAVTAGQESVFSPPLVMTPLASGTTSAQPTQPVDPSTWIQGITLPGATAGGKTYLCTNYTGDPTGSIKGTFSGNVCSGCSFNGALSQINLAGGDLIVLFSPAGGGSPYAQPSVAGFTLQNPVTGQTFNGTGTTAGGWTYIVSDQDPVYNPSGKLPAYSYTAANLYPVVMTCTGTQINAAATSATLSPNQSGYIGGSSTALTDSSGNWLLKSGWYYVIFREGVGSATVNEERLCVFTQGSATITWSANNGNYINSYNTTGGLFAAALTTIQVEFLPGVTPYDAPNMPVFNLGLNGTGLNVPPLCTKVRVIGANWVPNAASNQQATDIIHFQNPQGMGDLDYPPAESIYFDRCMAGSDTGSSSYGFCAHGVAGVNCNHFLFHQGYIWGIATNFAVSSGDANNYTANGTYHCWQNSYISCVAECHITGGIYVGFTNQPQQFVARYNVTHKPMGWTQGANVPIATFTTGGVSSGPVGANGCTLAATGIYTNGWPFPSGVYPINFNQENASGTFTNGSAAVSFAAALAHSDLLFMNVQGNTPYGLWGRETKNHWEQKAGDVYEYYGNIGRNNWVGVAAGYHGSMFSFGARDQVLAGASTNMPGCVSWNSCNDIYVHDNAALNVGCMLISFTDDGMASCYDARVKVRNNLAFLNPALPLSEESYGVRIYGPSSDHIVQHNTCLVNQQLPQGTVGPSKGFYFIALNAGAGSYISPGPAPFGPNSFTNYLDRLTCTDNIFDSGPGIAGEAFYADSTYPYFGKLATLPNSVFGGNLTITDTQVGGPYAGVVAYPNIPYSSVGFANVPSTGPTVIPYYLSDWDVTSGARTSTDGLPLGATFVPPQGLQFPLVGGVYIAGSVQTSFGTSAFQDAIANNNDVAVIGTYPGWTGGGFTMQSAAAAIKAINPTIKLVPYTNIMELEAGVGPSGSAYSPIFNAATAMNWFLRTAWPAGSITDADGNAQDGLNQTTFTVAGTGSYAGYANYLAWRAAWTAANEYPGSNWDGVYLDNVFSTPRVSADYNQSGSSQSASAATANWQNGYSAYAALGGYLRTALPAGKLVFGNAADWANTSVSTYNGMLDGPVIEGVTTYQTTWATQIAAYKASMLHTRTPSYAIYCQDGVVTNYQFFRYGFTMCLLDNAYYYHSNNGSYDTVEVYDEYSFNLGAPIAGPNNAGNGTLSSGGLTVWKSQGPSGVWRRDFVNGIAICNPAGNGSQSVVVDVSVNYWHLRGTQANPPNSATEVTAGSSVTLADGDGLILSRTAT